MHSQDRQRLEELAAGLALGNLEATELQELQQGLATRAISLEDLVALLQTEGVIRVDSESAAVALPGPLRARVLEAATRTELGPLGWGRAFWPAMVGGCLVAGAIVALAADNLFLRRQLAQADRQRALWERVTTARPDSGKPETAALTAPSLPITLVATTQQVFNDHVRALTRERGPADFLSSRSEAVWQHFRAIGALSSPPPPLTVTQAELLGGSFCQFKATRGIRFSYVLEDRKKVSLYQLSPLPAPETTGQMGPVYVNSADGTNMILWGDGSALYAVVAELPLPVLKRLASI